MELDFAATLSSKGKGSRLVAEPLGRLGAGNRIRTGDPQLGKLMLYQLSYSRVASLFLP